MLRLRGQRKTTTTDVNHVFRFGVPGNGFRRLGSRARTSEVGTKAAKTIALSYEMMQILMPGGCCSFNIQLKSAWNERPRNDLGI